MSSTNSPRNVICASASTTALLLNRIEVGSPPGPLQVIGITQKRYCGPGRI